MKKINTNYQASGVDIEAGDRLVDYLRSRLPHIGGFSGLFPLAAGRFKEPMLVASADGVGTKLMIAAMADDYSGIGFDLVGMVVNDLITCGAEPLFFLDYIGTSRLDGPRSQQILDSIMRACEEAGCLLLGGETAEMPGFYKGDHTELVGFGVGIVDKAKTLDGSGVKPGDALIGVPSSGVHSNGYSLVRKIAFGRQGVSLDDKPKALGGKTVKKALLQPTVLYPRAMAALRRARVPVRAAAHITGGGIAGNLVRVLPEGAAARIEPGSWKIPKVFGWLQERGGVASAEMYKVFNMGLGLIVVVPARSADRALAALAPCYPGSAVVGRIERGEREVILDL